MRIRQPGILLLILLPILLPSWLLAQEAPSPLAKLKERVYAGDPMGTVPIASEGDGQKQKEESGIQAFEKLARKNALRIRSIKEAAGIAGVQAGVKFRYDQINDFLDIHAHKLDRIYNFKLLLEHGGRLFPPIIAESNNSLRLESKEKSIETQVIYKIISQARIVSAPPDWRSYLLQIFTVQETISNLLLPRNDEEQAIWKEAVQKGWNSGIKQADRVFVANLNRLTRDFKGLLTYKMLALQDIISVPFFAQGNVGIQVNGKTLDVNQKVFRITKQATFNKAEQWTPIVHTSKNQ
ncbi:MAG: type IV secretion system DotC family protein [Desulfobacteraceae bacterium]|nr:type IV secretion system DotC family protein [Desulfobacteraceae bacterium]